MSQEMVNLRMCFLTLSLLFSSLSKGIVPDWLVVWIIHVGAIVTLRYTINNCQNMEWYIRLLFLEKKKSNGAQVRIKAQASSK